MQVEEVGKERIEEIEKLIEKNYGCRIDLSVYRIFINKKGKIYLFNKVGLKNSLIRRASYIGLYFGKIKKNEKIQLSTEGSQIVGKSATKNIAILDEENLKRYMEGLTCFWKELINCEENNFVLIKNKNDYYGSGILRKNFIESLTPKGRRIMSEMKKI
ncbi:MAG: hypothetical protein RMJ18_00105 [Candidatus Aenigmarchaeota archaeon]|nr:hypothetical protein [Candidatus Aenigmarchaeota archaeon]MCX8190653.1 hypothetical protein [Candidatus Aenigmarchaeota archaeon]MDW8159820.1 hypothetical protein [Candidatus Aenigmarchaeota archaeon]